MGRILLERIQRVASSAWGPFGDTFRVERPGIRGFHVSVVRTLSW